MLLKYRFLALALCFLMTLSLFACGGNTKPGETAQSDHATPSDSETVAGTNENDQTVSSEDTLPVDASESTEASESEDESEVQDNTVLEGFDITENDGVAGVVSPEGLEYTVSGYTKVGKSGFNFKKELAFDFGSQLRGKMNRFTISYESTVAIKLYVTYVEDGEDREEVYYLESGKKTFSGLIVNFLDKKYSGWLKSLRAETLESGKAEFVIYNVTTEGISVPERLVYIEGSRYKLGIDLGWGGAISYLSDKSCGIADVENLINCHDPGRLVQQSYYGTGAIEGVFEWGSFNQSDKWPYNPVQGGDKVYNSSRLIDVEIKDDYIYVKAQPMDWGKIGYITPSYMENVYKVEDDHVQVDNRFVDFSGWDHPANTNQELPAFYTLSYFDTFIWYDGGAPWTSAAVSQKNDLPFWGDSQFGYTCQFPLMEPNTETWCAWVNEVDNYGIGIYVPNIDKLVAGRYQYNGTKDAAGAPTNYVAPINQIQLVAFKALEYSYMISCGSADEIRATFTEHKDFETNEGLRENNVSLRRPYFEGEIEDLDFTSGKNLGAFSNMNSTEVSFDESNGAAKLTVTGSDPYAYVDYRASSASVNADEYKYLEIKYMVPATNSKEYYDLQIFFCTEDQLNPSEANSVRLTISNDGKYHTIRINLQDLAFWTGKVNSIRFDYFGSAELGDVILVKSFRLTNDEIVEDMAKISFDDETVLELICNSKSTNYSYDSDSNALKLEVKGADPYIIIDYKIASSVISTSDYTKVAITYMIPTTNKTEVYESHLFPCAGEIVEPVGTAIIMEKNIIADGEYHTVVYDLSGKDFWTGELNKLRFDYVGGAESGDLFYIKSIELIK